MKIQDTRYYKFNFSTRQLLHAKTNLRRNAKFSHLRMAQPATPNAIYTQQRAKPTCQEDINAKFSQLLLAQLPQTQFTHSTPPNPHARKTSTQNFRSSYGHSYPKRFTHNTPPNPHASKTSTQNFHISS